MIKKLLEAKKGIYKHVGIDDGCSYSIDDGTNYYWLVEDDQITYAEDKKEIIDDSENYYSLDCYHVYEGKEYTAVLIDDHNMILMLFDNNKVISIE